MRKIALAVMLLAGSAVPGLCAGYDDLNVAFGLFNQRQFDLALPWFDKAIAAGDLMPDLQRVAYLDRGDIHWTKGDKQKAAEDFGSAIAAKPDNMQAYRERIRLSLANGAPEQALADYEMLRKLRPLDFDILINTGWLDWELGHTEAAADAFTPYATINSPVSWMWLQLSNVKLGRPITNLKETAGTRRWPVEIAHFYEGQLSEAEVLDKAKTMGTEDAACTANLLIGLWHKVHDDKAGAMTLLLAAIQKCPKQSPYGRIALAELAKAAAGDNPQ